jgi:transposase
MEGRRLARKSARAVGGSPVPRSAPYLGLVPSESSSGGQHSQGAITKTGNTHARGLLVEAAWHHRRRYRPSRELIRRQDGQPPDVRARAEAGSHRLHRR